MNVIRFNEPFEGAIASITNERRERGLEVQPTDQSWRTVPLFDYSTTIERSTVQLNQITADCSIELKLPFPVVRIALVLQADGTRYCADFLAQTYDEGKYLLVLAYVKRVAGQTGKDDPILVHLRDLPWNDRREGGLIDGPVIAFRYHGRWLPESSNDQMRTDRQNMAMAAGQAMMCFALDAMNPNNHVTKVCPNQPGRSVQWLEARTHYTLISHGHPANRKEVALGSEVEVDRAAEIQRIAHNRRAHFRLLQHSRYRFARGKHVFVRATWVGPKEWKEKGGQQIYRILEPVI